MEKTKNETKRLKRFSRDERDALLLLSYRYLRYGKINEAKRLLLGVHAARPRDSSILPLLAYAQLHCHKPKSALRIMNELKKRAWNTPEYYLLMAQILQEMNRLEDARQYYKQYALVMKEQQAEKGEKAREKELA